MKHLPILPPRSSDSHKGTFGHVLLLGGSPGMYGAIALAGKSALRAGAGKVTIATPKSCTAIVASFEPCCMTVGCPEDEQGRMDRTALETIAELLSQASCVAVGPGLGQSEGLRELVVELYTTHAGICLFDADALNLLAGWTPNATQQVPAGPRILTPHPGEFRRLARQPSLTVDECRGSTGEFAKMFSSIIACKGDQTLVSDGQQEFVNSSGNPGMATAGAGDVLCGVIAALCGQGLTPFEATCLGVYLHGVSGDLAAAEYGQVSMIASDLIDFLPQAFKSQC